MELPHNTVIAREMKEHHTGSPVASWAVKRRWVNEAFDTLAAAGYRVSSAQELVKDPQNDHFIYRDSVWRGADLLATGVASFGHLSGVHYQNLDQLEDYLSSLELGHLPLGRALTPTKHQLLIREMALQLKEGQVSAIPFREKFGVDILDEFGAALGRQQAAGYLAVEGDTIRLTRKGLLQVDTLLPEFFEPEHRAVRYT
jgi:oxygen-independent coproporphyrinogen-3 oxidase